MYFFKSGKNLQVQLMSFNYINVETIGECNNVKKMLFEKMYTSPAYEFLLYTEKQEENK